ncbi:MAG TPA: hypothetical protein VII93_02810 [Anaerolineales bacterium]
MAALTVVTVTEGTRVPPSVLEYARSYQELHEIEAEYILASGKINILHRLMDEHGTNILLLGGYSVPVVQEVMPGSAVNIMLRSGHCPIFICR